MRSWESHEMVPRAETGLKLPFRVAGELVANDGDAVNDTTSLEVGLDFLRRRCIVNLEGIIVNIFGV